MGGINSFAIFPLSPFILCPFSHFFEFFLISFLKIWVEEFGPKNLGEGQLPPLSPPPEYGPDNLLPGGEKECGNTPTAAPAPLRAYN